MPFQTPFSYSKLKEIEQKQSFAPTLNVWIFLITQGLRSWLSFKIVKTEEIRKMTFCLNGQIPPITQIVEP